ncbi:MAG: hypothetical protein NZ108_04975, partial [Bacteroidia bacterium]|nr:hypothetical protein [Bacteroidia bacterium]
MPAIKLNHLTNLADARFAAAENVSILSFSLEEGSLRKISPELLTSIQEWLSVDCISIDYGNQLEQNLLPASLYETACWKPFNSVKSLLHIPLLPLTSTFDPAIEQFEWLEIHPSEATNDSLNLINEWLGQFPSKIILNVDKFGKNLHSLKQFPVMIALGE